jgi:hypothetical protein
MNIESLEISLFKASEIKDGDIILIKTGPEDKAKFNKDNITSIYNQIKGMVNKDISIYFFPKDFEIELIKYHVEQTEINKDKISENTPNEKV